MGYTEHAAAAIARHGYLAPSAAGPMGELMAALEGHHPRQIALQFRKTGVEITAEEKRAMGLRANTKFTAEATRYLTELGREDPVAAIEVTFLDAIFRALRARSIESASAQGFNRFKLDAYGPSCAACARLNGQIVGAEFIANIPPSDCAGEWCRVGFGLHFDFLAGLSGRLDDALVVYPKGGEIKYHCMKCGGSCLTSDDEVIASTSHMRCKACGLRFGSLGEIQEYAISVLANLGLKAVVL